MQNFRKPDLNAPRYRVKRKNLLDQEFLNAFAEKYPQYKKQRIKEFQKMIHAFNTRLWETIIDHRDGIELPENLGHVFIGSCMSIKRENVDYGKSIKYGAKIIHKNYSTDGYVSKIFYTNYSAKYKIKHRNIWGFKACRVFKRTVTKAFQEDYGKYVVIDPTMKTSKLFTPQNVVDFRKKLREDALKDYNEFEMD